MGGERATGGRRRPRVGEGDHLQLPLTRAGQRGRAACRCDASATAAPPPISAEHAARRDQPTHAGVRSSRRRRSRARGASKSARGVSVGIDAQAADPQRIGRARRERVRLLPVVVEAEGELRAGQPDVDRGRGGVVRALVGAVGAERPGERDHRCPGDLLGRGLRVEVVRSDAGGELGQRLEGAAVHAARRQVGEPSAVPDRDRAVPRDRVRLDRPALRLQRAQLVGRRVEDRRLAVGAADHEDGRPHVQVRDDRRGVQRRVHAAAVEGQQHGVRRQRRVSGVPGRDLSGCDRVIAGGRRACAGRRRSAGSAIVVASGVAPSIVEPSITPPNASVSRPSR